MVASRIILVREIEAFCRRYKVTPTFFGIASVSTPRLVFHLRKGGDITTGTMDKVRAYMAAHRKSTTRKRRA